MKHGAPEAVNLPYRHGVELVLGSIRHQLIQGGASGLRAGEAGVDVLAAVLPSTAGDVFPKFSQLHFAVLIGRADTGVEGAAHQGFIVHYFLYPSPDRASEY
jgi:hypothetical protein